MIGAGTCSGLLGGTRGRGNMRSDVCVRRASQAARRQGGEGGREGARVEKGGDHALHVPSPKNAHSPITGLGEN